MGETDRGRETAIEGDVGVCAGAGADAGAGAGDDERDGGSSD